MLLPFEAAFSDYNRNIHSSNHTIANLDVSGAHQARFAKLGVEFMMELGKSDDYDFSASISEEPLSFHDPQDNNQQSIEGVLLR